MRRILFWNCMGWMLVFAVVFWASYSHAHDSWINKGGYKNKAGEWCCGEGDCFMIPKQFVTMSGSNYVIVRNPWVGIGPTQVESVPYTEAMPSPDGEFWRCKRPDGSRRCFFAPPPGS